MTEEKPIDLDSLPKGTLVRGHDGFQHIKTDDGYRTWRLVHRQDTDLTGTESIETPVTVLYNPEVQGTWPARLFGPLDVVEVEDLEPKDIFSQARELINGDRQQDYGDKQTNFQRIADLWTAYSDSPFSPKDVAVMMILVKVARIANTENHKDSWLDIIGYAGIGEDLE